MAFVLLKGTREWFNVWMNVLEPDIFFYSSMILAFLELAREDKGGCGAVGRVITSDPRSAVQTTPLANFHAYTFVSNLEN